MLCKLHVFVFKMELFSQELVQIIELISIFIFDYALPAFFRSYFVET